MIEITESHVAFIREDIRNKGVTLDSLVENLVDHICCALETHPCPDFEIAYTEVIHSFGEKGILKTQKETILALTIKKEEKMKKVMFVIGFIALFLSTTGIVFKLQHWPGASIILVTGVLLINFAFLPMYFIDRYKRAVSQ